VNINLGSPYLPDVGSNSPKLSALTNSAFGAAAAAGFPTDTHSPHTGFNLAAFRTPGLLGTHGFNIGFREYNSGGFDFHNQSNGLGGVELNDDLRATNSPSDNRNLDNNSYNYYASNGHTNGNKKYEHRLNGNSDSEKHLSDKELKRRDSRENSPSHNNNKYYLNSVTSDDIVVRRTEDTDSPVGSSRSFSSQKNEDFDYHSSHNDSIGSHSPENLSSSTSHNNNHTNNTTNSNNNNNSSINNSSCNNNNNNNNINNKLKVHPNSINEMLDHKLHLSFLGPPLAALHSMTEMKSQGSPQAGSHNSQGGAPNPHGIDTILSRPPPVTSAQLNALAGGKC
jgi:homeobox protein Nkx-6.1